MNNIESLILVAIILLVLFVVLPSIYNSGYGCNDKDKENFSPTLSTKQDNSN